MSVQAAVQLCAGVYAARPWRARDPVAAAGDVDLVVSLPPSLPAGTLLVLPPELAADAARRWALPPPELVLLRGVRLAAVLHGS